jgi:hypothetical protein
MTASRHRRNRRAKERRERHQLLNAGSSHNTLLGLPDDLIAYIISALPVADRKSLALACSKLQTLVVQGAETLALAIRAPDIANRVSAPLLAAIRRRHGKQSLRLTLAASGCDLQKELAALGTCPAVEHLELRLLNVSIQRPLRKLPSMLPSFALANLALQPLCRYQPHLPAICMPMYTQSQDRWTEECSLEALKIFPNLDVLTLDGCEDLWPFWPLLQGAMPLKAFRMQNSNVYQGSSKTCSRLFACTGFRGLELDKSFVSQCQWHWLESIPRAHLSSVLTHLSVEGPTFYGHNDWLGTWVDFAARFPALQSLSIHGQKLHEVNNWWGVLKSVLLACQADSALCSPTPTIILTPLLLHPA